MSLADLFGSLKKGTSRKADVEFGLAEDCIRRAGLACATFKQYREAGGINENLFLASLQAALEDFRRAMLHIEMTRDLVVNGDPVEERQVGLFDDPSPEKQAS